MPCQKVCYGALRSRFSSTKPFYGNKISSKLNMAKKTNWKKKLWVSWFGGSLKTLENEKSLIQNCKN